MTNEELAYIAGLVDGEGCIGLSRDRGHSLYVSVTNNYRPVLDWLKNTFGGYVGSKLAKKGENRKTGFQWIISGNQIVPPFIDKIRPYLRIKTMQAWLALEFVAQRTLSYNGQGRKLPLEEQALREGFYRIFRDLNRRGL